MNKNLALKEFSYVVELIVPKYDVTFAPAEDRIRVWAVMKDEFTACLGALHLVFRLRAVK